MATILERRNRDGGLIGYQVRKKGYPAQIRTYDRNEKFRPAEVLAKPSKPRSRRPSSRRFAPQNEDL